MEGTSIQIQDSVAAQNPSTSPERTRWQSTRQWWGGVLFTFVVALLGLGLSKLPVFDRVGPLGSAILIAVLYRQVAGYPEALRPGIAFSAKRLLRAAIVLFGLKLNVDIIFHQGLGLLARGVGTIVFALIVVNLIAKWVHADRDLSFLLSIGTGVCGAAAIAAVSPITHAKEQDTAIGAGIIALLGTVFAIAYTLVRPLVHLPAAMYGVWSGVSLHEIAQVALAAAPAGPNALAIALLAKLGRVFLLVPLSFVLMFWMRRKQRGQATAAKVEIPWFLGGFILMSLVGSYMIGKVILVPASVMTNVSSVSTFVLTMAMVGLGLNVSVADLRSRALRPLLAISVASVLLSVLTLFTV